MYSHPDVFSISYSRGGDDNLYCVVQVMDVTTDTRMIWLTAQLHSGHVLLRDAYEGVPQFLNDVVRAATVLREEIQTCQSK